MARKFYFEVTINEQASHAGIMCGLASQLPIDGVVDEDVGTGGIYPNASVMLANVSGNAGYPMPNGTVPTGPGGWGANGTTVGVAVDLNSGQMWWKSYPDGGVPFWSSGAGVSNGDPVAGLNGCTFLNNPANEGYPADSGPFTGLIYILCCVYYHSSVPVIPVPNSSQGTINFGASPFVAAIPSGYEAYDTTGGTILRSDMCSSSIQLSNGNLSFATVGTVAPDINDPIFTRTMVVPVFSVLAGPIGTPVPANYIVPPGPKVPVAGLAAKNPCERNIMMGF